MSDLTNISRGRRWRRLWRRLRDKLKDGLGRFDTSDFDRGPRGGRP